MTDLPAKPLVQQRLANQRITKAGPADPAAIVRWLGVVQAQEFGPAKWALGLRMPASVTEAKIQRAFDAGRLLRTHVLRPTWHFVTPADIRWMIELSGQRLHRAMAPYDRRMGLDAPMFARAAKVCERVLRDGQCLTRRELAAHFEEAGLPGAGFRVGHIALYLEAEGVICSGPRAGKQSTYALFDERVPAGPRRSRDEALHELARRYFRSHGPATLRDFVWWSGLATADARRGLEMSRARKRVVNGATYWTLGAASAAARQRALLHLLPIYDEYLVAYRDRAAVPHGASMLPSVAGGFVKFQHAVIVGGQVAGTWRPAMRGGNLQINVATLRKLTAAEQRALERVKERYRRFVSGGDSGS